MYDDYENNGLMSDTDYENVILQNSATDIAPHLLDAAEKAGIIMGSTAAANPINTLIASNDKRLIPMRETLQTIIPTKDGLTRPLSAAFTPITSFDLKAADYGINNKKFLKAENALERGFVADNSDFGFDGWRKLMSANSKMNTLIDKKNAKWAGKELKKGITEPPLSFKLWESSQPSMFDLSKEIDLGQLYDYNTAKTGNTTVPLTGPGRIVEMTPQQYFDYVTGNVHPYYDDKDRWSKAKHFQDFKFRETERGTGDRFYKYTRDALNGDKFNVPALRFTNARNGDTLVYHDGRHRAAVAGLVGQDKIPVYLIDDTGDVLYEQPKSFSETLSDGIKKLGYKTTEKASQKVKGLVDFATGKVIDATDRLNAMARRARWNAGDKLMNSKWNADDVIDDLANSKFINNVGVNLDNLAAGPLGRFGRAVGNVAKAAGRFLPVVGNAGLILDSMEQAKELSDEEEKEFLDKYST